MKTTWQVLDDPKLLQIMVSYARYLDEQQFDAWLDLFSRGAVYRVLIRANYDRGENFYLINDDVEALRKRIEAYKDQPQPGTLHLLSNHEVATAEPEAQHIEHLLRSNTVILRQGELAFGGTYRVRIDRNAKIKEVVFTLAETVITREIPLPI